MTTATAAVHRGRTVEQFTGIERLVVRGNNPPYLDPTTLISRDDDVSFLFLCHIARSRESSCVCFLEPLACFCRRKDGCGHSVIMGFKVFGLVLAVAFMVIFRFIVSSL